LTVWPVGFDPSSSGVELLLIDSRERHGHVGGEYAARRLSCERAAADIGVASLREATSLDKVNDPVDARRARHVLTENQRVLDFVAAVGDSNYDEAGRIFTASHASMRDDFAITTPHIDLIARTAVDAGALGARMTGGGFGGCVIALVPADRVAAVSEAVQAATDNQTIITQTYAAAGASAT
jgi:galactokinase